MHSAVSIPSKNSCFKPCQFCPSSPTYASKLDGLTESKSIGGHKIVKKLTIDFFKTLRLCNPSLQGFNFKIPQRDLTFPSQGVYNDGYDNIDNEYILKVHDVIINAKKNETYVIEDLIGKGTFGQVIKCYRQNEDNLFAIKIIKNLQVYNFQALQEIQTLRTINQYEEKNPQSQARIVKLVDQFIFRDHVCLVFPLHHISLFDFLCETKFEGLQMDLIRNFIREILEGVQKLHSIKVIHCDLKPENILLQSKENHSIKIIDLGSALAENASYYDYIQSLFYRAPEIFLGLDKTPQIDMWSIGCIAVELYLGQPLFAGPSSIDQMTRILNLVKIDQYDQQLIQQGSKWQRYFKIDNKGMRIKTREEFQQDAQVTLQPLNKNIYGFTKFEDLRHEFDKSSFRTPDQMVHLNDFIDFVQRLLRFNPSQRLTPSQALDHPFIKEVKISLLFEKMLSSSQKKKIKPKSDQKIKQSHDSRFMNQNSEEMSKSYGSQQFQQIQPKSEQQIKTSRLSLQIDFNDQQPDIKIQSQYEREQKNVKFKKTNGPFLKTECEDFNYYKRSDWI